jgi:saccharopine dehydrogenase (NAD+, L-lysine-forming)
MSDWLVYGANGYTGRLIAEEAVRRGMKPVLGGRRADAVRPIAERLGLAHHVFPLEDAQRELGRYKGLLLAAGPFAKTSAPAVAACLANHVHYLDITGELDVFEAVFERDAEAKSASVVLLPGVGFDVVPTDCLAAALKKALPKATELELAISARGLASRGTMSTAVMHKGEGGAVRRAGRLVREPFARRTRRAAFRDRTRRVISIPWGDLSTAYWSTKIPDITTYLAASRAVRFIPFLPKTLLRWGISRLPEGPSEEERRTRRTQVWGRVAAGRDAREGTLVVPEGYAFTAAAAVECMRRVLDGKVAPGAHTPSTAFGAKLITEIPGCDLQLS